MVNKNKYSLELSEQDDSSSLFSIDDDSDSVPAAGNRNGTSLNNAGENGNYWSSTPNESNTNNAYNLNFNSSNHNMNNNNRNNGFTVRPVSAFINKSERGQIRYFSISPQQLLIDLYRAYKDARKKKRSKEYQLQYEFNLEDNLVALRDELLERRYIPKNSTCFIIHEPKMREVFAADFRDRIVHHLLYNYIHSLFERTFIHDSYSCIKKRGTHFGIERLKHHIRSESSGYTEPCYVLKIDIKGYFMNIDKNILLSLCSRTMEKMKYRASNVKGFLWSEILDYDFIDYLLENTIMLDPTCDCKIIGQLSEWDKLPHDKSLFYSNNSRGLPIGNLSSQLFSNIYLNELDQYVKRTLKCKHYGRYVDDVYIVSKDRDYLFSLISPVTDFLKQNLHLEVNPNKIHVFDVNMGVEFLGAYIKPFRTYVSNRSLKRLDTKMSTLHFQGARHLQSVVNSYLGMLSHYDSFCIRRVLFGYKYDLNKYGKFDNIWHIFTPFR